MSATDGNTHAERIAEALVLADADEPDSLEAVCKSFKAFDEWAAEAGPQAMRDLTREGCLLAARLCDGGEKGADALLRALTEVLAGARALLSTADPRRHDDARSPAMSANPLADDAELVADFVERSGEHLDTAEACLLRLEREPGDAEAFDALFRAFHTLKGMAGFLSFDDIERAAHEAEERLDRRRDDSRAFGPELVELELAAIDRIRRLAGAITGCGTDAASSAPTLPGPASQDSSFEGGPASQADAAPPRDRAESKEAVRVDATRLDLLLDTIGELVIAESMVSESVRAGEANAAALLQHTRHLDKITRELQAMATSLRMAPVRSTFRKMSRLVRDLARETGKEVDLELRGEDTELDKSMVDALEDPLMHLVRNSVDHGLEDSPAERVAAGKPKAGKIALRAYHGGGSIHIEVSDDGRGFDREAVAAAAMERGLIDDDGRLAEQDLLDLVYRPGFSTADCVTDVSGRGVGMDVVRRAVDSMRGQIEITSEAGQGACVHMRLPLTLAIIDGMTVRVGDERYVVPTLAIARSIRPAADDLSTVLGRGEMLQLDGELIPLVRLEEILGVRGVDPEVSRRIVIVAQDGGYRAGLVACELLGQQQVVIKSLGARIHGSDGISGGAIMPDGTVGLIIDVAGLVRLAHAKEAKVNVG